VYGFSDWIGLRINGVLVLNIVIAVALTMEFTAHIGRAFVLTSATPADKEKSIALPFSNEGQIRMKKTLREMFTPVSLGALTTLIGVAPIAAAQFPYFRQYYFSLYVMIVLFGWLNGVIFQVVLLSFFPPKSFEDAESSSMPLADHQDLAAHSPHETIELEETNATTTKKEAEESGDGGTIVDVQAPTASATPDSASTDGAGDDETGNDVEVKRKHTRESKNAP
jgi:predicted RND superfamily exporter protein